MIITIKQLNEKLNSILKEFHPLLEGRVEATENGTEYILLGLLKITVQFKDGRKYVESFAPMNFIQKHTEIELDEKIYNYSYKAYKALLGDNWKKIGIDYD